MDSTNKHRLIIKTVFITLATLALLTTAGGYAFMRSGLYNVASTSHHMQFIYSFLEKAMHYSVQFHARDIEPPPLTDRAMIAAGGKIYHAQCVECHGAPGIARSGIGMGMQPVPGPLVAASGNWSANQLYWIMRHGIKMSGMPAWEYRMTDEQLWQVVAFMKQMPNFTPADYKEITTNGNVK